MLFGAVTEIPSIAFKPFTVASRRFRSSESILSGPVVSPSIASIMPLWIKCVVHDSILVLNLLIISIALLGPIAAPSLHPVMANRFEQV